jgi:hypothetical protein
MFHHAVYENTCKTYCRAEQAKDNDKEHAYCMHDT